MFVFRKGGETMDGRRRRRMIRKSKQARRRMLLWMTFAMVIGIGTIALGAQGQKPQTVYYESVRIHAGDTLWEIAETYKADTEKTEHMIDKILACNQMKTTNIQSGDHLLIPIVKAAEAEIK